MIFWFIIILTSLTQCCGQIMYSNDWKFRVEAGGKTCYFETAKEGDIMEVFYQVVDGQHGDLDISLDVIDPQGVKIISDYKKSQNVIIKDVLLDGDYTFCLDNTFSAFNSKLVFIYVLIESRDKTNEEAAVTTIDSDGNEVNQIQVLKWQGTDENGEPYYLEVEGIATTLTRTLRHVMKARHLLDLYGASKSRDAYLAYEGAFIVDIWSCFQISFMFIVGMLQVCMIKKLFKTSY